MSALKLSSVAKKVWMALMGIFLVVFLPVHLGINALLVIFPDTREPFNVAANFMGTNPIIKVMEIFLFGGFFFTLLSGLYLNIQNRIARPTRYKVSAKSETSAMSKQMLFTAILIFIFLVVHMLDFYLKAKFFNDVPEFHTSDGQQIHDLGILVIQKFNILGYALFYAAMFIILGFHLWHGFHSSFQSLGINHPKFWTKVIKTLGYIYTIIVVGGFLAIDLIILLSDKI